MTRPQGVAIAMPHRDGDDGSTGVLRSTMAGVLFASGIHLTLSGRLGGLRRPSGAGGDETRGIHGYSANPRPSGLAHRVVSPLDD